MMFITLVYFYQCPNRLLVGTCQSWYDLLDCKADKVHGAKNGLHLEEACSIGTKGLHHQMLDQGIASTIVVEHSQITMLIC